MLFVLSRPVRPARSKISYTSSRGRCRQPRVPVFLVRRRVLRTKSGHYPVSLLCPEGTASREPASTTDEKSTLASVGPTDQVESSRSYPHPPLLVKSPRDLDGSRAVCPISRTSVNHGPQLSPTPIRKMCQWGIVNLIFDA